MSTPPRHEQPQDAPRRPVTLTKLAEMRALGEPIVMVTAYDHPSAKAVEAAGVDIVLTTVRNQAMGTDLFTQLGCDLAARKIIVVKSAQHFQAAFSKITNHVVYVAAPGTATVDLNALPYRKIRRPKWPLR